MYAIVGRLNNQSTPLSHVKICDILQNKVKWITETELLHLHTKKSVYNLDLATQDLSRIPVYTGDSKLKRLTPAYKNYKIAVAIVVQNGKTIGWKVYSTEGLKLLRVGSPLEMFMNITNIAVNDIYNKGIADEYSITYLNKLAVINK